MIARRSDRLTEVCLLQDKVTLFETMMTTMNEVNRDKTKVPDFFCNVSLVCFTAELDEQTDSQSMYTVSLLLKLYGYKRVCKPNRTIGSFVCFNPLVSVVQL